MWGHIISGARQMLPRLDLICSTYRQHCKADSKVCREKLAMSHKIQYKTTGQHCNTHSLRWAVEEMKSTIASGHARTPNLSGGPRTQPSSRATARTPLSSVRARHYCRTTLCSFIFRFNHECLCRGSDLSAPQILVSRIAEQDRKGEYDNFVEEMKQQRQSYEKEVRDLKEQLDKSQNAARMQQARQVKLCSFLQRALNSSATGSESISSYEL